MGICPDIRSCFLLYPYRRVPTHSRYSLNSCGLKPSFPIGLYLGKESPQTLTVVSDNLLRGSSHVKPPVAVARGTELSGVTLSLWFFIARTEMMNPIIIPITLFSKIIGICSLEMVTSLGE